MASILENWRQKIKIGDFFGSKIFGARATPDVASSMQKNGFDREAEYILTVASWDEASDGRGLSQLDRCKPNHQMLNYLLDEFLPWHRENYDFTTLDINRFVHL